MYEINDDGLSKLLLYKTKSVAEIIGVHVDTIRAIKRSKKLCSKQTAYCLSKFLDNNAEIEDYFIRKEK